MITSAKPTKFLLTPDCGSGRISPSHQFKLEYDNLMTNRTVELSIKHIFEELCYNLAQSKLWGDSNGACHLPKELVKNEREGFRIRAYGLVSLFTGTSLNPVGTPLVMYMGVAMPQDWADAIKEGNYWPKWVTKSLDREQSERV